jgi:hypothetical protein
VAASGEDVRFGCVCGATLRAPAVPASKSATGKCPKCRAPFAYRDGEWVSADRRSESKETEPVPSSGSDSTSNEPAAEGIPATAGTSDLRSQNIAGFAPNDDFSSGERLNRAPYLPGTYVDSQTNTPNSAETLGGVFAKTSSHPIPTEPDAPDDTQIDRTEISREFNVTTGAIETVEPPSQSMPGEHAPQATPGDSQNPHDYDAHRCEEAPQELPAADALASQGTDVAQRDDATVEWHEESDLPQARIRKAISDTMRLQCHFQPNVASAIALACHPWPDGPISTRAYGVIAAEMLPGFNICHPDLFEIATDRLLRIGEALNFEHEDQLAKVFVDAASHIQATAASNGIAMSAFAEDNVQSTLIQSPLGINIPQTSDNEEQCDEDTFGISASDRARWASMVSGLVSASVRCQSNDIGVLCGGDALNVTIEQLAQHLLVALPGKAFDSYLKSLDSRRLDILRSRTFTLINPLTLLELAERWSLTRERVRQLERRAIDNLLSKFSATYIEIGNGIISPLKTRVIQTERLHETARAIARNSEFTDLLAAFVLDLNSPWYETGTWSYHGSLKDRIADLPSKLNSADKYGLLEEKEIHSACEDLFLDGADRAQYLVQELGLGHNFGIWTIKNTLKCQLAAALKRIGRPATKEELADLLGIARQNIGASLGNINGIVRADRYRWGFEEWINDRYDGIVGEIEQRIEEYHGSVPVHVLLQEIPTQFNVSEGSVRAYLASAAFIVENDLVRMAHPDEYMPRNPADSPGAIRVDGRWAYKTSIYERHFNGYSLGVNFDIAYANGIRPGDDLIVPIEGSDYEVSLIWRNHSLNRLVDVGRVAEFLSSEGFNEGDEVVIIPSRTSIRLFSASEVEPDVGQNVDSSHRQRGAADSIDEESRTGPTVLRDPLLELLGES